MVIVIAVGTVASKFQTFHRSSHPEVFLVKGNLQGNTHAKMKFQ